MASFDPTDVCGKEAPDGRPCILVPGHTLSDCYGGVSVPPRRSADSPPEPEPEHWVWVDDTPTPTDLATLVALGRELLAELRTLTSTLGQRMEQEVPTRVNAWQERKPLRGDVAGHYGGHEYRVPRGQS